MHRQTWSPWPPGPHWQPEPPEPPRPPDQPDKLCTLTNWTTLATLNDEKIFQEDKCSIRIVYLVLFLLLFQFGSYILRYISVVQIVFCAVDLLPVSFWSQINYIVRQILPLILASTFSFLFPGQLKTKTNYSGGNLSVPFSWHSCTLNWFLSCCLLFAFTSRTMTSFL